MNSIDVWKVCADRYEADAASLRRQAEQAGIGNPMGNALLTASYVAGTHRNAMLDVYEKMLKSDG